MSLEFEPEQKRWLEGFSSGLAAMQSLTRAPQAGLVAALAVPAAASEGPDAALITAQDSAVARGGKLTDQEKWKRREHPLDAYARLKEIALTGAKPKPDDNFRWRFHGLFYVAPAQDSYMCRLRAPNGILKHWQFAAIADLADRFGGGYAHITTRANLQVREIEPENAAAFVEALTEIGIIPRGAGADNIRNVTGSATAGVDPQELLDTRPHAHAWHHHILNTRAMFNLPRKFNVGFDGAGLVPTLEDTNDIGFQAVEVAPGAPAPAGIYYRLCLGGITGHKDFARDTGALIKPDEAVKVADAIVRVFADHGDRTDRGRARMKYVLDDWGFEKFLIAVEERLGSALARVPRNFVTDRPTQDRQAHIGVRPQKQPGRNWIGLVLPVGRLSADQMRAIANLAQTAGDGDLRLTVWQNLLISGVPDAKIDSVKLAIEAMGLDWRISSLRAGLVACTGNSGCKFANSDTKRHALDIAKFVEASLTVDQPVNIHLTGCPNSCAQHYIGDIGLVGVKVPVGEEDSVEGYDIYIGGGFGVDAAIGRLIYSAVKAEDAPARVERLLRAYLQRREHSEQSFQTFACRHEPAALRALSDDVGK